MHLNLKQFILGLPFSNVRGTLLKPGRSHDESELPSVTVGLRAALWHCSTITWTREWLVTASKKTRTSVRRGPKPFWCVVQKLQANLNTFFSWVQSLHAPWHTNMIVAILPSFKLDASFQVAPVANSLTPVTFSSMMHLAFCFWAGSSALILLFLIITRSI